MQCLQGSNVEDDKKSKRENVSGPRIRITPAGITAEATNHKE